MAQMIPSMDNIPFKFKIYSNKYDCWYFTVEISIAEYIFSDIRKERPVGNVSLYIKQSYLGYWFSIKHGPAE